jgi:hypothetical protein
MVQALLAGYRPLELRVENLIPRKTDESNCSPALPRVTRQDYAFNIITNPFPITILSQWPNISSLSPVSVRDQVPFTRLRYYADYSSLTKRMGFPVRQFAMYRKNPPKKTERHAMKGATYFPKYSHYINRKSSLSYNPQSEYIRPTRSQSTFSLFRILSLDS